MYSGSLEAAFKSWKGYRSGIELVVSDFSEVKLPLGSETSTNLLNERAVSEFSYVPSQTNFDSQTTKAKPSFIKLESASSALE